MKLSRTAILLMASLFFLTPQASAGIGTKLIVFVVKTVVVTCAKACYHAFDEYDVGLHVYITENIVIDPYVDSEYELIEHHDNWKSSIGIYVADIASGIDGSDCYVRNTEVHVYSEQASACGYYHANNGAASGSAVGGVMYSDFYVQAYEGVAMGIYTEYGTSFVGGIIYAEDTVHEYLSVSDNYIEVSDFSADGATTLVNGYGIYADGDWSGVDVSGNTINVHVYSGTATGIFVATSEFAKSTLCTEYITVQSDVASAIGINFQLDDGDEDDDDHDADGTLHLDSIASSTLNVSNLQGGDEENSSATGILFSGGSYDIGCIYNMEIDASTMGVIALGIAVDYSDSSWDVWIDEIYDTDITLYAENGLAAGIYLDTQDANYAGYLIGRISDLTIDVTSKGNVYGYVLGAEVGVGQGAEEDAGYAFYNSYYANSSNIAEEIDFESISLTLTSTGANDDYSGNAAYGIYLADIDLDESQDISFSSVSTLAAGTSYGLYLDNASIAATLNTDFSVATMSGLMYGALLENNSTIRELAGSISLDGVSSIDYNGLVAIAVYIDDSSSVNLISTDIQFNVGTITHYYALWMQDASDTTTFNGTVTLSNADGESTYLSNNFYVYLIGDKVGASETLLFYNAETSNSEGIEIGSDASILIEDLSTYGEDAEIYGVYVTGEGNSAQIEFDITLTGCGVYVSDGASVTLSNCTIDTSSIIVTGAGSHLTVSEGVTIDAGVNALDGGTVTLNFDVMEDWYLSCRDGGYAEVLSDLSVINSDFHLYDNGYLSIASYACISFDADSNIDYSDSGTSIVIDLSDVESTFNYTLFQMSNDDVYDDMVELVLSDATQIILSDYFTDGNIEGCAASYGDDTTDMDISYSVVFDCDDSSRSINIRLVATAAFDYFQWQEDEYGNMQLELAEGEDAAIKADFSAYSSQNLRLTDGKIMTDDGEVKVDEITTSFVNLSYIDGYGGAAICYENYGFTIEWDKIIGGYVTISIDLPVFVPDITGDFVGNYNYATDESSRGGAIFNGAFQQDLIYGDITGDFIGNYAYSAGYGAYGGVMYNDADNLISIETITGDFVGNYAYADYDADGLLYGYTSKGGVFYNEAQRTLIIESINSYFESNYLFSVGGDVMGGVFYNKSFTSGGYINLNLITADFVGNYAATLDGDAMGGVFYNYTNTLTDSQSATLILGSITGDFADNYASTQNGTAMGGVFYNESSGSISLGTITSDFLGNSAYSSAGGNALGGVFCNIVTTELTVEVLSGDFIANYAYSADGDAYGGAIYNQSDEIYYGGFSYDENSLYIPYDEDSLYYVSYESITGNFIGNYVSSDSGEAKGGAIYNQSYMIDIDLTFTADTQDMEFTGNYADEQGIVRSEAIYNEVTYENYFITLNFVTEGDYRISINDGIDGGEDNIANQILSIKGSVDFNNRVANHNILVETGELSLGSYEGTSDLFGDGSNVAVAASLASLEDCMMSIARGACLTIATNDNAESISLVNTSLSFESGAILSFDTYASLSLDASSTISLTEGTIIVLDLSGIAEDLDYTLFTIEDEAQRTAVYDFLQTSSYVSIKLDSSALADYGDEAEDYLTTDYYIDGNDIYLTTESSIELSYYKWTSNEEGQLLVEETDQAGADFSVYVSTNTAIVDGSDGQDVLYSFMGLEAASGGAVSNIGTEIGNIQGDFIANKATEGNGGAIYNSDAARIESIEGDFIGNYTINGYGGAISNTNEASIGNITGDFIGNHAEADDVSYGGAIYNTGEILITDSSFIGNWADIGGAIYNEGILTLLALTQDVELSDNTATVGGAIYNTESGSLNIAAYAGQYVTINDSIANDGIINVGHTLLAGTVVINSALTGSGTMYLNAGTLLFASNMSSASSMSTESSAHSLVVMGGDLSLAEGSINSVDLGILSLASSTTLSIDVDLSLGSADYLSAESLTLLSGDETISLSSINIIADGDAGVFTIADEDLCSVISLADDLTISSTDGLSYDVFYDETTGQLQFTAADALPDTYTEFVSSSNGLSGASLLNHVSLTASPAEDSDLYLVMQSMQSLANQASNTAADRLAAALAGASVTALGSAQMQDMTRQLNSLRNRANSSMLPKGKTGEQGLQYAAWVTGEGGYNSLSQDGSAAGHSISTVGGSVGADIRVSDQVSMGAAFTTCYGDLSSKGPDAGEGDLDTQYISLYANYKQKNWAHGFAFSLGLTDAELTRTISHENGNYQSKGKTDGSAFALAYELSRAYTLNEEASCIIKPSIAISYIDGQMDGYSEHGSDASLIVGEQENRFVRLASGAQVEGELSHKLAGGPVTGYARAMIAIDLGDRASSANVSLEQYTGSTQYVEGAEYGLLGINVGAGLMMPLTDRSSIFADVSAECRSKASSISGSLSYRISF